MKVRHAAEVSHDRDLIARRLAFRNTKVWPTRKLQRLLMAAILVAIGFILVAPALRYGLWAAGGLLTLWVVAGDVITRWWQMRTDPYARAGVPERFEFGDAGFRRLHHPSGEGAFGLEYDKVLALLRDRSGWLLVLPTGEVAVIDEGSVDGGALSSARFEKFLRSKIGGEVEVLDSSLSSRVQGAQESRRSYLESRKGKSLFSMKSDG